MPGVQANGSNWGGGGCVREKAEARSPTQNASFFISNLVHDFFDPSKFSFIQVVREVCLCAFFWPQANFGDLFGTWTFKFILRMQRLVGRGVARPGASVSFQLNWWRPGLFTPSKPIP